MMNKDVQQTNLTLERSQEESTWGIILYGRHIRTPSRGYHVINSWGPETRSIMRIREATLGELSVRYTISKSTLPKV
jgi:hypothetical protein